MIADDQSVNVWLKVIAPTGWADQSGDGVPCLVQVAGEERADESRDAGECNAHVSILQGWPKPAKMKVH